METEMTQKAFKALSDGTRLKIVSFLAGMCCGEAAIDEEGAVYNGPSASEICCHITGAEKITSTVSHHLHELEAAGLIRIERHGKKMVCSLKTEAFDQLSDEVRRMATPSKSGDCC